MTPQEFKEARQTLGLDQQQMADAVGLGHRSRISNIETGAHGVTETMALLVQALLDGWRPKT